MSLGEDLGEDFCLKKFVLQLALKRYTYELLYKFIILCTETFVT